MSKRGAGSGAVRSDAAGAARQTATDGMKVALVCDWLTNVGGAEKVLLQLHRMYPEAPIYTSQYNSKGIDWFADAEVRTGWLQMFPSGMRRVLGPLRQRWFARLNLAEYDLVISVTGAEAKAVKAGPSGKHISYCHVPTQYYWQMYDEYVKHPGFGVLNPVVRWCFKTLVKPLRKADFAAAQGVDEFVTISEYARELIEKYYKRTAKVIHPPVDTTNFSISGKKSQEGNGRLLRNKAGNCQVDGGKERGNKAAKSQDGEAAGDCGKLENKVTKSQATNCGKLVEKSDGGYYVTTSRQVTWKRLDLAVKACAETGRELYVIGEGPEHNSLVRAANGVRSVRFLPLMGAGELAQYLQGARGHIFPSLEPFGIAPVEALAAGCPVIAYGEGGALDYVKDGENGVLFPRQTVASLREALERFEGMKFDRVKVAQSAEGFSEARFEKEMREVIAEATRDEVTEEADA